MFPCKECGIRWAQERGLCRRCRRERGDERPVRELNSSRVRMDARVFVERLPFVPRSVTVRGRDYEVVWDGSAKGVGLVP